MIKIGNIEIIGFRFIKGMIDVGIGYIPKTYLTSGYSWLFDIRLLLWGLYIKKVDK